MSLALSTRLFGKPPGAGSLLERLEALDLRGVFVHAPQGGRGIRRSDLKGAGVACVGVGALGFEGENAELEPALRLAARLRARSVVLDPGAWLGGREAGADALLRALHPLVREGVPVALLPGGIGEPLLRAEVLAWVLEDLPALRVWLAPHRLRARAAEAGEPPLVAFLERWAPRCAGAFVSGDAEAGRGGRHPEEGGLPWGTLRELLPRGVPWVLDLDPEVGAAEVADAVRFLRAATRG